MVGMSGSAAVRPKHVVKTGKTPVLEGQEWRRLIDAILADTARDLRDRAPIATLTYGFARIGRRCGCASKTCKRTARAG